MGDMEEYLPDIQQEKKIEVHTELYKQLTGKKVFKGDRAPMGDGSLLALKLSQQVFDKSIYVFSENNKNFVAGFKPLMITKNPVAVASGMSRFHRDQKAEKIVCFSDAVTTKHILPSIFAAAERNENMIYICNNAEWLPKRSSFARLIRGQYVATASVGFVDDYITKLKKVCDKTGFRFIDVLAPSPKEWGFDASNTLTIARLASQSRLWPLYEIENNIGRITKRPDVESVGHYINSHSRTSFFTAEDVAALQKIADKGWKQINDGVFL